MSTLYSRTAWSTRRDILITGIGKYINFNAISGALGYGIRDNAGTIEVKNNGGSWQSVATNASVLTPTESPDGNRITFTFTGQPKWITINGVSYYEGTGYIYAAFVVTLSSAPRTGAVIRGHF